MTPAEEAYRTARAELARVLHGEDEPARTAALAYYLATLETLRPRPVITVLVWAPMETR